MKTWFPYWPVCCFTLAALLAAPPMQAGNDEGLNRKIKIPESKGNVYELLEKVTERSGYLFIYDSSVINNRQAASIKKGEYTIRQAIYEITGNHLLNLSVTGSHILIRPPAEPDAPPSPGAAPEDSAGFFTIEGSLLNRYTREPVTFATVGVPQAATGTVSNLNGKFRLRLPDSLRRSSVHFSHTGYLTQESEAGLLAGQPRGILLEPKVISLQEIVVRLVNPLRLIHSMRDSISENYAGKPVYLTSFYREGIERKKGFVNLTEAVFKLYKTPRNTSSADQVKLLKMRRISNEKEQDTLITKIKSGVDACLMLDVIKNFPDFLSPGSEHRYNYLHSDITVIDNCVANMISFEQKKETDEPLYRGELFLDADNNALLSARFEIHPKYVEKATAMLVTRKSRNLDIAARQVVYHVSYKPWNGTYYISHIRGDLYFRIKKRNRLFGSTTVHTWFEMATCKIETENVSRFTRSEALRTRTVFAETSFTYDNDFWGNFNIILPEEKLHEAVSRITSRIEETGY
jgi:hypothetical protein